MPRQPALAQPRDRARRCLSAIPPMTRADPTAHWDEIVTDPRLRLDLASQHLARTCEAHLVVATAAGRRQTA